MERKWCFRFCFSTLFSFFGNKISFEQADVLEIIEYFLECC